MIIPQFIKSLFIQPKPQDACDPDDLQKFDEARERLAREVDEFSKMVRGMRGERVRKRTHKKKEKAS